MLVAIAQNLIQPSQLADPTLSFQILQLVGNGGGLVACALLVYYMLKQAEKREEEARNSDVLGREREKALQDQIDKCLDVQKDMQITIGQLKDVMRDGKRV